ncbi:putative chitinase 10 [Pseudolycoriella hygida]|uniref:Chitinase 10 n=1 Tax=Pseudolycoriella hygida TaxID=35572 RepID=A0A9Q0NBG9_9DIPT|nr:putative chitinase 10 [Pseudolycoriella hygida]
MIAIKAITIVLFLLASESAANVCSGRWNGDQLPNPADCGSFFVCNFGEPKLFKCLDNLLYDPVKRVCNWAYLVTCGQTGTQEHVQILPNPPYYPEPYPEVDGQPSHNNNQPQVTYPPPIYPTYSPTSAPTYTGNPPPLIDNPNVPDYSQTHEFYPGLVESIPNVFHCTNPEFYFAPHPRNCEKYFICENYRIHSHQCGEGIQWDYVYNQCDFPKKTFCFAKPTEGIDHIEHILNPSSVEDHHDSTSGVTGPIAITSIEPSTVAPSTAASTTTAPPTAAPTTLAPSTAAATTLAPSTLAPSTAQPVKPFVIECPGSQAFIAHPDDCHKYYICIGGIPIVTSCPVKMAWDKELAQCNEEAWSQCFG